MSIFVPNNSGTVTFTNGSTAIEGVGTLFTNYRAGSVISIPGIGEMQLAADPTSDTVAAGIVAWQGATAEDKAFQYLPRNEEGVFTDKLTQLLSDLGNGNMQALAGLTLSASKVLVGTGPGALGLADRSEFVNGVRFNARVPDEAGLAPYASKPGPTEDEPGYTVLIEAYGVPPRTVLVSKASDTNGDWTDPAYVEGNIGEKGWSPLTIRVEDGERQVIQLSGYIGGEGDAPTANVGDYLKADGTWTATIGDALDVRGASFNWIAGGYNGANAYAKRDALRDQGASWIALQAVPPGNPPPTLPTTSNSYWDLMTEPGEDGTGQVNSVGAGAGISVNSADPTAPIVSVSAAHAVHGQCRLIKDGSNIKLIPVNGNKLRIAGVLYDIPDAGVTLAPTSLGNNNTYNIYAYMNAGVMTLFASVTGHSPSTTAGNKGVEVMTGDDSRTLVGMARTDGAGAWADSQTQRFVLSWFNRRRLALRNGLGGGGVANNSAPWSEISTAIRVEGLTWAGVVFGDQIVQASHPTANVAFYSRVGLGTVLGTVTTSFGGMYGVSPVANYPANLSSGGSADMSEGYFFATLQGGRDSGTVTYANGYTKFELFVEG